MSLLLWKKLLTWWNNMDKLKQPFGLHAVWDEEIPPLLSKMKPFPNPFDTLKNAKAALSSWEAGIFWTWKTKRKIKPTAFCYVHLIPKMHWIHIAFTQVFFAPFFACWFRSFQSWSRPINTTVFATSWTTSFLPSTSCTNSSSTPAWVTNCKHSGWEHTHSCIMRSSISCQRQKV